MDHPSWPPAHYQAAEFSLKFILQKKTNISRTYQYPAGLTLPRWQIVGRLFPPPRRVFASGVLAFPEAGRAHILVGVGSGELPEITNISPTEYFGRSGQ